MIHPTIHDINPYLFRNSRYQQQALQAYEVVENSIQELSTAAIALAVSDAWYEWDQNTPEGTEFSFDPDILSLCPDEKVRQIAEALAVLSDLSEDLATYLANAGLLEED